MALAIFLIFGIPLTFFILFFIGIVMKKKRLWVTSLIFFIVIVLAEILFYTPSRVVNLNNPQTESI